MKWLFHIPEDGGVAAGTQLTIRAKSWFSALNYGLDSLGAKMVGNISCMPAGNGAVEVRDYVSGRVFHLYPFDDVPANRTDAWLSTHIELFGGADRMATDGAVSVCERLIAVPPEMSLAECRDIARAVLDAHAADVTGKQLDKEDFNDDQLVIKVAVYDHRFTERPRKPALVLMEWRLWDAERFFVTYPLSGDPAEILHGDEIPAESIRMAEVTSAVAANPKLIGRIGESENPQSPASRGGNEQARVQKKATDVNPELNQTNGVNQLANSSKGYALKNDDVDLRDSQPKMSTAAGVDGGVLWAFEQLQQMYTIKSHDKAAEFIRDTVLAAIPSEACAVLLNSPGRDELYLAAEQGFSDVTLNGVRIPTIGGIAGATICMGAVVRVNDPGDDRLNPDLDLRGNFDVRTMLLAPMAYEGHNFGIIELFNRQTETSFTEEDANILSYVAGAFAEYVCNSLPSREAEFSDREFDGVDTGTGTSPRSTGRRRSLLPMISLGGGAAKGTQTAAGKKAVDAPQKGAKHQRPEKSKDVRKKAVTSRAATTSGSASSDVNAVKMSADKASESKSDRKKTSAKQIAHPHSRGEAVSSNMNASADRTKSSKNKRKRQKR